MNPCPILADDTEQKQYASVDHSLLRINGVYQPFISSQEVPKNSRELSSPNPPLEFSMGHNFDFNYTNNAFKTLPANTNMGEFIRNAEPMTIDRASVFKEVLHDELSIFKAFVKHVFDNQHVDIVNLLDQEEISLRGRYAEWTRMFENRSKRVKKFLCELIPDFDWEDYRKKYGSQTSVSSSSVVFGAGPEGDLDKTRQETFLKLLFLEDEAKKLQAENNEMLKAVEDLRSSKYTNHTRRDKAGKLLYQNNIRLEKKLNLLREERNRLASIIHDLTANYKAKLQNV